jgi:hypothetical protein
MKATIGGEDEEGCGIEVVDNAGIEHWIEIKYGPSEISHHGQDGYPDEPSKRDEESHEHVNQARRYARWHVYRERGFDTLPAGSNPDRILATLLAIARLSATQFDAQFGDLRRHIESHYDGGPVELPFPDADPDDVIVYRKDVFVEPDPTTFDPPVLDQFLGRMSGDSDSPEIPSKDTLDAETFDNLDFTVEAVSDLQYLHYKDGTEQTVTADSPLDREPDATVELLPFDPDEVDSFHHYVVSHLAFQIRDCFLRMGVEPPIAFRKTGWGMYRAFHAQKFCPQYENYWDPNTDIDSWEPAP